MIFYLLLLKYLQILYFGVVLGDKVLVTFMFPVKQYNMEKRTTLFCIFVDNGKINNK